MPTAAVYATPIASLIALLVSGSTLAQSPDLPGDIEIALNQEQQARIGLGVSRLEATQAPETMGAIALVLDISPLAQLNAEVESASAIAAASASTAQRLTVLANDDQNASLQNLEAARAQAASDAARLRAGQQRIALEWGPGLAARKPLQRQQLIEQLAAGTAALLRVDPLGAKFSDQDVSGSDVSGMQGGSVQLRPDPKRAPLATRSLGPAANTDPRMQSSGLLVLVQGDGAASLRPGLMLPAEIATGWLMTGVVLPRSALIRAEGATWVYLHRGGDDFARREVIEPRMQNDGWFVSSGFAAGDEVVVNGAGSLLAVERIAAGADGAETDDATLDDQ
jgi:hypothetical protein